MSWTNVVSTTSSTTSSSTTGAWVNGTSTNIISTNIIYATGTTSGIWTTTLEKSEKEQVKNILRDNPTLMSEVLVELRNEKIKKLMDK